MSGPETPHDHRSASLPQPNGELLMNLFCGGIRQHGSHNALANQNATDRGFVGDLQLDAIVVPGSRSAENLDHAVTLARAADCWLLVICSQRLERAGVEDLLAARL